MANLTRLRRSPLGLLAALLAVLAVPAGAWAAPTITEFTTPAGSNPTDVAAGPDGNVWFVEFGANKIGRITPSGAITEFSVPTGGAGVSQITLGPDNNLWFTEYNADKIGRITPTGTVTEFSSGGSGPFGITAGPDGALWFTQYVADKIARITTAGVVTGTWPIAGSNNNPYGITAGADGNLWFTEAGGIGKISTSGTVTPSVPISGLASGITAGPDGNVWFADSANPGSIGRISPAGTITSFTTGLTTNGDPLDIVTGSDGNLYFSESASGHQIGQITPAGVISEFTTALTHAPAGIAAGPDGNIWFAEGTGARIGRLTVAPIVTTGAAASVLATSADLAGTVKANSQATTYHFDWGLTTAYGSATTTASAGSGATAQPVGASLAGLAPLTTYHFRVVATNATGTSTGADATFTTAAAAPAASTGAASSITATGADLAGTVTPNSQATTYYFDWGLTTAYGAATPTASAGAGGSAQPVVATLTGLAPFTTYHVRVVAANATGTTIGADATFTTAMAAPAVTTGLASAVDDTHATLSAEVNPNGIAATYHFELGLTTAYGDRFPADDAQAGSDGSAHSLSQSLSGLIPGMTYHYRAVAANGVGVSAGADATFTTAPAAPAAPPQTPSLSGLPPATPPVFGSSAKIVAVSGTILVQLPHGAAPLSLDAASTVPVGTTIDATAGTVKLTNVRDRSGRLQTATFWGGAFTVRQAHTKAAATVIRLAAPACAKSRRLAAVAAKPPRVLHLWGHDNRGRFVTHGQTAVATVRGTTWFTEETCAGTVVRVTQGTVSVRDLVRGRTVVLTAGHRYLARRR